MAKVVYFCNFSVRISCCSGELAGRPLVEASPRQTEAATSTSPPSFLYGALISQNTTEKLEQLRNNTTKSKSKTMERGVRPTPLNGRK